MAESGRYDATVVKAAAAVISRLEDRLVDVTRSLHELLVDEIPELRGDAQMLQLLYDAIVGNLDASFSAIRRDIPMENIELPVAVLEHVRRRAQRGLPVIALVRAHRLGHQAVLKAILDEIRAANLESKLALDVYERVSTMSFNYIDWLSQRVISVYQDEYARWLENRSSLRTSYVRELLSEADIDVDAMTTAIRYPLNRIHLALIVWCDKTDSYDGPAPMERFVRRATESIGARESCLFVPVDDLTGWTWIPLSSDSASGAVGQIRALAEETPEAPRIAVGNPLSGVDGFRRSHRQAQDAYNVVMASDSTVHRVTAAGDPGLMAAALLAENMSAAAEWVGDVLGPLAAATENDVRLRETLRVFLRNGSSYTVAAEELHLHFNTVRYRVQRAIERRGRPIADDRCDVELALILCYWFGTTVLS